MPRRKAVVFWAACSAVSWTSKLAGRLARFRRLAQYFRDGCGRGLGLYRALQGHAHGYQQQYAHYYGYPNQKFLVGVFVVLAAG